MAFNSLNTIDKDCVTVANRGRNSPGCAFPGGCPGECWAMGSTWERVARGLSCPLLLPVSTCTTWFFPFFPFFLVMNVGVPPAYREKQCALCFPGIFLTRYSSFVYQPRTILVGFILSFDNFSFVSHNDISFRSLPDCTLYSGAWFHAINAYISGSRDSVTWSCSLANRYVRAVLCCRYFYKPFPHCSSS